MVGEEKLELNGWILTMSRKMEDIYFDPSQTGSFGGIHPLVRKSGASERDVRNWLISQDAYTLHKQPRKVFRRRKTLSKGINDLWQADLVDLTSLSRIYFNCHRRL